MIFPDSWAATQWWLPVSLLIALAAVATAFSYWRSPGKPGLRVMLATIRIIAIGLLAICLLEPMIQFTRPEPGANLLMVLADDSQSLQIKDRGAEDPRSELVFRRLNEQSGWLNRLSEVFDVRRYQFDNNLRPVANFSQYDANRRGSRLLDNLKLVANRFDQRPAAGMIVITDGNDSTLADGSGQAETLTLSEQLDAVDWSVVPPIYPVVVGSNQAAADIQISRLVSSQSNFETAPISISAEVVAQGLSGQKISVELLDETGELLERKEVSSVEDNRTFVVRFQTRPRKQGINAFQVRAFPASVDADRVDVKKSREATLVNNEQRLVVNRGRGPYRVLYVCGRPNWELKFLRRAMLDDPEVNLVSLIRIAKREARFTFIRREGQQSNSLFRGYETQDDDTTEQHDEPVFLRIGTLDEDELRGGFPKEAEALYQYDAIILDDVEADFFNADQQALLQQFVASRGGGLMMMGGQDSFASGKFDRTPVGEMLPVYLDRLAPAAESFEYRLDLTREGWLQPWVRVKTTETEEKQRLREMPGFLTINRTDSIKPGATVLATVSGGQRKDIPALVVQPFGKGRVGAMLIGDFWRWHMQSDDDNQDQYKAWRQMTRWLVADVPRRVELEVERATGGASNRIEIRVRDESYLPYDNAKIDLTVQTPEGAEIQLSASPSSEQPGVYESSFATMQPGVYRARAAVTAEDGSEIESREFGWVCDPDRDEFNAVVPNRKLLTELAERSGGQVLEFDQLDRLPNLLESSPVPISQRRSLPWWHRWVIFATAVGMLVTEWGIRRWKGLP